MTTGFGEAAWERVLNQLDSKIDTGLSQLDGKIDTAIKDIKSLDTKLDNYVNKTLTRDEFDHYQDLRRTTIRWAIGTIIAVMMLLATATTIILAVLD